MKNWNYNRRLEPRKSFDIELKTMLCHNLYWSLMGEAFAGHPLRKCIIYVLKINEYL